MLSAALPAAVSLRESARQIQGVRYSVARGEASVVYPSRPHPESLPLSCSLLSSKVLTGAPGPLVLRTAWPGAGPRANPCRLLLRGLADLRWRGHPTSRAQTSTLLLVVSEGRRLSPPVSQACSGTRPRRHGARPPEAPRASEGAAAERGRAEEGARSRWPPGWATRVTELARKTAG